MLTFLRRNLIAIVLFALLMVGEIVTGWQLIELNKSVDYLWWRTLKQPRLGQ